MSIFRRNKKAKPHYSIIEVDEREARDVISGVETFCVEHLNWMNREDGYPLLSQEDQKKYRDPGEIAYQMIRLEQHARKRGWID